MTIEPRLASVPTVLAAALATVLGDARAQERVEKPPIKAERAEPRRTPESGESHLLFFERVLLVAGKDKLGRTEFEIGKEERRRSRKQPDEVRVQITFLSDRRSIPKPISLELLEGVVENAERTGDSPWSLSELKLARSGGVLAARYAQRPRCGELLELGQRFFATSLTCLRFELHQLETPRGYFVGFAGTQSQIRGRDRVGVTRFGRPTLVRTINFAAAVGRHRSC